MPDTQVEYVVGIYTVSKEVKNFFINSSLTFICRAIKALIKFTTLLTMDGTTQIHQT